MRASLGLIALLLALGVAGLLFVLPAGDARAAGPGAVAPAVPGGVGGVDIVGGGAVAESAGTERTEVETIEPSELEASESTDTIPWLVGRVVDSEGGPIEGATVLAATGFAWMRPPLDMEDDGIGQRWVQRAATETDAAGRFALDEPLKPGNLRVAVRADHMAPRYLERLRLGDVRGQDLGDIALPPGVTLAGRVVDRGGEGIANVQLLQVIERGIGGHEVSVPGRGVLLGESGAEGEFRVSGLAPGPWALMLDSTEHQVREERGRADVAGEQGGLLFVLERGDEITGRVEGLTPDRVRGARVDARVADSERKREDVDLHLRARRAGLASDGSFRISGMIPGVAHRLTLWEQDEEGRFERSSDVQALEVWPGSRDVVLEVEPRASLAVTVVDSSSGQPVEDFVLFAGAGGAGRVNVRALEDDEGKAIRTHPGGRAVKDDLRPPEAGGRATVRILAPGYQELERTEIPIRRGEAKDLGTLAVEPGPSARVTVVSAIDATPIEGARVLVTKEGERQTLDWLLNADQADPWSNRNVRAAMTDEDGVAVVSLLPAERCIVAASAEGHVSGEPEPLSALTSGETELTLELTSGGHIRVLVVDGAGEPVAATQVQYRRVQQNASEEQFIILGNGGWGRGESKATDADGFADIGPLEPGSWRVELPARGAAEPAAETVEVAEGGEYDVTLTAPVLAAVEGIVTESRVPLSGADLSLTAVQPQGQGQGVQFRGWPGGGGGELQALSDHDGRYRIEDVPPGEYELRVTHVNRYMPESFELTVSADGTWFDVELPLAVLEGTVRYEDGRPVPDLDVTVTAADGRRAAWRVGGAQLVEDDRGQLQPDWNGSRRRITTDRQGRYRVVGVAAGVALAVQTSGPYATTGSVKGITLAPDEVRADVDLTVGVAGRLRIRLADGTPQGAYAVTLRKEVEEGKALTRGTQLWGNRARTIDGIEPGTWTLELRNAQQGGGDALLTQTVEVVAEQVRELTLDV